MPKRIVERQDPTRGFWHRWAQFVTGARFRSPSWDRDRRVLLVPGLQINPAEAQLKDYPEAATRSTGARRLTGPESRPG
jgi:hypothetical protein